MTRYACNGPGCPVRTPVAADAPPTCYTCGRPMARHGWGPSPLTRLHPEAVFAPRAEHTAAARMRGAMLDWVMRVRELDIGEETRTAILFHAKHPGGRPGCYLDERPWRTKRLPYPPAEISKIHASIRLAAEKCQPDYPLLLGLDDL